MLAAARRQFSELGYDRATMRSIAAQAGVDQKLLGYFFGSKQALFVAATTLPIDGGAAVAAVLGGNGAGRGERLARLIVGLLEDPDAGIRLIGLIRAAASDREAAGMVRELLGERIWSPATAELPVEDPELAVNLIATHVLGLMMARYVIGVEPLASLPVEHVVSLVAPILQRHLATTPGRSVTVRRTRPRPRTVPAAREPSRPVGPKRGTVK